MKSESKLSMLMWGLTCLLLGAILATNLWQIRQTIWNNELVAYRQARVQTIRELTEMQDELIFDLLENYEDSAYGSSVDRIAEQQLIAAEAQIAGLQTIALQNRQITELLMLSYEPLPADSVTATPGEE